MAADSDGLGSAGGGSCGVVVTCEGDLRDPRFPERLRRLLRDLRTLLAEPHPHTLKVNKVSYSGLRLLETFRDSWRLFETLGCLQTECSIVALCPIL